MDRKALAWIRALTIIAGATFIVVTANSATSWKRQTTNEERITQLESEVKRLEFEAEQSREAKKAQDKFNQTIIRIEESRSK